MVSGFTWLIVCFCILVFKYVFLMPLSDKQEYKIYEKRDKLALESSRGKISQDLEEYEIVIKAINAALYFSKNDYNFMKILKDILTLKEVTNEETKIDRIKENPILYDAFESSEKFFLKRMKYKIVFFKLLVLKPIEIVLRISLVVLEAILSAFEIGEKIVQDSRSLIDALARIDVVYRKAKI